MVHDTVAQKNFDPVLPPLPDNIDEDFDEESVKIVRLVKNKEPLVCGSHLSSPCSPCFHPPTEKPRKGPPTTVFGVSDGSFVRAAASPCGTACVQSTPFSGWIQPPFLWPSSFVQ